MADSSCDSEQALEGVALEMLCKEALERLHKRSGGVRAREHRRLPALPRAAPWPTDRCAAAGCPLMGTIRRETSHDAVCPCHARASTDGWPKATAVIARHHSLWWLAREAQCSPTPDALSVDLAADLLRAAKCAGVGSMKRNSWVGSERSAWRSTNWAPGMWPCSKSARPGCTV